ncbi:ferritin-like domain-containing protein [Lichenicoccus roseus]|uniref:Ferritin-like domain-containing protein n=1 Tax=Lichenicoccus roseus TaxID=2683649 RepID=A0A5R9JHB0_9PROT|nr:ferritin-like domain-containing protein [Lichenicoccus roseus]TLU73698.1 ferritin-like domain-containing protein [Lichenicoccus roseus]
MIDVNKAAGEWGEIGRRKLMKQAGMGAAAIGAMSAIGVAATSEPAAAATYTDADILNFALNLEYLEAEYYLRAVTGSGLSASLVGATGGVTAPSNTLVPFQIPALAYYAQRIANDELAHVVFLRTALGSAAVAEPAIDFVNSFTTLAVAAGLISAGQTFNPFESEVNFLLGSYIFEDVGVTAYAGAANLLTNPDNLSYAASVLAVEAYHAGAIRGYLSTIGAGVATNAISALRATLSGVADDNGTQSATNPYQFNNVDYNGQVFRRTPQQVLNIVYGGASPTAGLFFPKGVNGMFTSSAT